MKRHGPDSLDSWLVTAGLTFLSMVLYSVVRLSGVLFVASMDRFGVDRKSASFPYTLTDFIQAISCPLTGFLASKFGARFVMVLGCCVSGVGIASCFFAQTIEAVTISWGVVFGIGFGLSIPLIALVITQHFVEKRATALGTVYFGSYVGYSILPSVTEYMIEQYGLPGTFLLIAGILLNCLPVALLILKPNYSSSTDQMCRESANHVESDSVKSRNLNTSNNDDYGISTVANSKGVVNYCFELKSDDLKVTELSEDGDTIQNAKDCQDDMGHSNVLSSSVPKFINDGNENHDYPSNVLNTTQTKEKSHIMRGHLNVTKGLEGGTHPKNARDVEQFDGPTSDSHQNSSKADCRNISIYPNKLTTLSITTDPSSEKSTTLAVHSQDNKKASFRKAIKVFLEPVYIVILLIEAMYEGSFIAIVTILVDFCLDVGLDLSDTKFVLLSFSVFSNVGLVSFGWVTDGGHLSLTNFCALLFVFRCATSAFIAFCKSMPALLAAIALHGICEAPISNFFPLIIAEHYALEVHEVAISCRLFLCAPVYLVTPTLIGYFRDGLGSYFYLFMLISVSSFVSGVLSFLIPQLSKFRCGRKESILRKRSHTPHELKRDITGHIPLESYTQTFCE